MILLLSVYIVRKLVETANQDGTRLFCKLVHHVDPNHAHRKDKPNVVKYMKDNCEISD